MVFLPTSSVGGGLEQRAQHHVRIDDLAIGLAGDHAPAPASPRGSCAAPGRCAARPPSRARAARLPPCRHARSSSRASSPGRCVPTRASRRRGPRARPRSPASVPGRAFPARARAPGGAAPPPPQGAPPGTRSGPGAAGSLDVTRFPAVSAGSRRCRFFRIFPATDSACCPAPRTWLHVVLAHLEDELRQRVDARAVEELQLAHVQRQHRGPGVGGLRQQIEHRLVLLAVQAERPAAAHGRLRPRRTAPDSPHA